MFGDVLNNDRCFPVKKYGEVFSLSAGGTPSTKNKDYWENGNISWIGSNLCQNVILYENDGKFITEEGFKNSSAKLFSEGTVLIALVGATIGKTGLLKFKTATNQNVLGIQDIEKAGFNPYYVFFYTQELYPLFLNIGDGKFAMASKKFVSELPIVSPPIDLQNKFAAFVELVDKLKFSGFLAGGVPNFF